MCPDINALTLRAAELFAKAAEEAINQNGVFSVAVSGGSTPKGLFETLGADYREKVDWPRVDFFFVDERCVPPGHKDSNYGLAFEPLLSKVPARVHRIRGEDRPEQEATRYEQEIRDFFGGVALPAFDLPAFDLIVLGMGADGHTASLFQGTASLAEGQRLVLPVYSEAHGNWRITLTLPAINAAKAVMFLVAGEAKAGVLAQVLGGGDEARKYPAGLVSPKGGGPVWLVDKSAGALLG